MFGYDFEIIYKKGKKNVVGDALSIKDEDVEALFYASSIIQPDWINEVRDEWKNDEEVWALIQNLQQDPITSDTFSWKNDLLWYKDHLYLGMGTQLAHRTSYHPQFDQQTKITTKFLEGYGCCFISDKKTQWVKWLPIVEWWYNTSFHIVAKMTAFMALYGYHPPSITSYLTKNSKVQAMEDHIEHQQKFLQLLKDNLTLAQNRKKQQADQHHSERSFDVGD
eukprot:PITA_07405